MTATDFIIYLFWNHQCELKHAGMKVIVKKNSKQSMFHKPFAKTGRIRIEEIKSICKDLGIPEPKDS
jgi:hypothetical protein